MPDPTIALVQERKNTHGQYEFQSVVYTNLMSIVASAREIRNDRFSATQEQSINMICLKLSRILAGDAFFQDHWDDIAGYAKIANGMPKEK